MKAIVDGLRGPAREVNQALGARLQSRCANVCSSRADPDFNITGFTELNLFLVCPPMRTRRGVSLVLASLSLTRSNLADYLQLGDLDSEKREARGG
jgi:hypothetical protein